MKIKFLALFLFALLALFIKPEPQTSSPTSIVNIEVNNEIDCLATGIEENDELSMLLDQGRDDNCLFIGCGGFF